MSFHKKFPLRLYYAPVNWKPFLFMQSKNGRQYYDLPWKLLLKAPRASGNFVKVTQTYSTWNFHKLPPGFRWFSLSRSCHGITYNTLRTYNFWKAKRVRELPKFKKGTYWRFDVYKLSDLFIGKKQSCHPDVTNKIKMRCNIWNIICCFQRRPTNRKG